MSDEEFYTENMAIKDAKIIRPHYKRDDSGWYSHMSFSRIFTIMPGFMEIKHNRKAGILFGLDCQPAPNDQAIMITCTRGEIFCALLDMRHKSSTFKQTATTFLYHSTGKAVLVPPGCAWGYQTTKDETEIIWFSDNRVEGRVDYGWDKHGISWPLKPINR